VRGRFQRLGRSTVPPLSITSTSRSVMIVFLVFSV
jgi:hypothetical protein